MQFQSMLVVIFPFFCQQEKKVQDNTDRLAQLESQIAGLWDATNSTTISVNELKDMWIEMNTTVGESSKLINKVYLCLDVINK